MDVLKFEFSSVRNKRKNMNYKVMTDRIDYMTLFARQHGFNDIPPEAIKVLTKPDNWIDDLDWLVPYKFRSNTIQGDYTIISTPRFVDSAIESIAGEISQSTLFGESIMRRDIELFKVIGDLVNKLEFAHVTDFVIADDETVRQLEENCLINRDIAEMEKRYRSHLNHPSEDVDASMILQDLYDAVTKQEYMPITIEGYISNFTEMMVDCFD